MARLTLLFLALACLFSPIGCWSQFKDERQELAYLEALSNPTPSQWKRQEELRKEKDSWPPELNSVVSIPDGKLCFAYSSIDAVRKLRVMNKTDTWRDVAASERAGHAVYTPEFEAVLKLGVADLFPGSKVKVLAIGDDYVKLFIYTDKDGKPVEKEGYSEKWWAPK